MMIKHSTDDLCNCFDGEDSSLFDFSLSEYKSDNKGTCHTSYNTNNTYVQTPKTRGKKGGEARDKK